MRGECKFIVDRLDCPNISHLLLQYVDKNLEVENTTLEIKPVGQKTQIHLKSETLTSNMCLFFISDFMYNKYKNATYDVEKTITPFKNVQDGDPIETPLQYELQQD